MKANALIEQIARPLAQLALVAAATFATSTVVLGLAWSIAYVPAAIAAWFAFRRISRRTRAGSAGSVAAADEPVGKEFWKFTIPRSLTSIIQILMQRFDIVLVGALSGAVNAAVYAAATRFIVVGQLGINALTLAAQPQFAEKITTDRHRAANELYQITTAWLVVVTWPIYLVLIVFAEPVLRVFGHGYRHRMGDGDRRAQCRGRAPGGYRNAISTGGPVGDRRRATGGHVLRCRAGRLPGHPRRLGQRAVRLARHRLCRIPGGSACLPHPAASGQLDQPSTAPAEHRLRASARIGTGFALRLAHIFRKR
jgi:hypothetical protein